MSKKYESLAPQILEHVGGAANVDSLRHCVTRLRFKLKDNSKANKAALEALNGVMKVIPQEGMYQVVIGTDVKECYDEIVPLLPAQNASEHKAAAEKKVSPFTAVIDFVSGTFQPVIPALSGAGMLKALLALLVVFKLVDNPWVSCRCPSWAMTLSLDPAVSAPTSPRVLPVWSLPGGPRTPRPVSWLPLPVSPL